MKRIIKDFVIPFVIVFIICNLIYLRNANGAVTNTYPPDTSIDSIRDHTLVIPMIRFDGRLELGIDLSYNSEIGSYNLFIPVIDITDYDNIRYQKLRNMIYGKKNAPVDNNNPIIITGSDEDLKRILDRIIEDKNNLKFGGRILP
jgi:hypothetical protein